MRSGIGTPATCRSGGRWYDWGRGISALRRFQDPREQGGDATAGEPRRAPTARPSQGCVASLASPTLRRPEAPDDARACGSARLAKVRRPMGARSRSCSARTSRGANCLTFARLRGESRSANLAKVGRPMRARSRSYSGGTSRGADCLTFARLPWRASHRQPCEGQRLPTGRGPVAQRSRVPQRVGVEPSQGCREPLVLGGHRRSNAPGRPLLPRLQPRLQS